jgi:hypothetical protein
MSSKKVNKREKTKRKIISGSGHQTHYTNRRIEPKRQTINLCNCAIKCVNQLKQKNNFKSILCIESTRIYIYIKINVQFNSVFEEIKV